MKIAECAIGADQPVYVIAELSANHHHDLEQAKALVRAAGEAGADAIKLQTYTADTLTLDCDRPEFLIGTGSPWAGRSLHALYQEAYTPWEWHAPLRDLAHALRLGFFSTPFDFTAVDFLEQLDVPAFKIASFELVDIPLIERVASTRKPIILSTGMGSLQEVDEAVTAIRSVWGEADHGLCLLKCTSAYPAPLDDANLRTLPDLAQRFGVVVGLSDHTLGITAPVAAVALGARVIEKHFTLSREQGGPDSAFSLEPVEFAAMVQAVRDAQQTLGAVRYAPTAAEQSSLMFRRSLFVVRDIEAGQPVTEQNVRSIRPAHGLAPRHWRRVLGARVRRDLPRGTPLSWEDLDVEP